MLVQCLWGDPVENGIGKRIRELRNLKGKTQEWLAEQCNVSVSSVARWETGLLRPNQEHHYKLAAALGVSVDDLYINSELPIPKNALLTEILDTVEKLDQPFQMHILQIARSLVKLTHPEVE